MECDACAQRVVGRWSCLTAISVLVLFIAPKAQSQTLQLANASNSGLDDSEYGADFVEGDSFLLTISAATPNASVTLLEWQNGVSVTPSPYYWGNTDSSGTFQLSNTETSNFIGSYEEKWYVNGVQVGNTLEFEVIDKPASLTVSNVAVASLPSVCVQNNSTYGIEVDILYNIIGATTGMNIATTVPMTPYEDVNWYGPNNTPDGSSSNNIGPASGYSDSSQYASGAGTFHDVPVGTCANFAFSDAGQAQTISVWIGNAEYEVRPSTRFTTNSSAPGHGSITNGLDVSATR